MKIYGNHTKQMSCRTHMSENMITWSTGWCRMNVERMQSIDFHRINCETRWMWAVTVKRSTVALHETYIKTSCVDTCVSDKLCSSETSHSIRVVPLMFKRLRHFQTGAQAYNGERFLWDLHWSTPCLAWRCLSLVCSQCCRWLATFNRKGG